MEEHKTDKADLAKLAELKKELGAEVMYNDKWLIIQRQYRDLYRKVYGDE